MAYTKTNWVNGSLPAINEGNLNKIEQGIYDNSVAIDQTNNNIGSLSNLNTQNKSDLVNAINSIVDSEVYSTSEVKTNKVWIDNKPIYRKVISTTETVTNDSTISHGIPNVDRIWIDKAFMTNNDGVTWDIPIDLYGVTSTSTDRVGVCVGKSVIQFKCDTTWDTWWTKTVILEYTKTTD